jgi:hypothetical protein
LEKISKKPVKEALRAVAGLVSFVPTKLPGTKIIAQALERFYYVKVGAGEAFP